MKNVVYWITHKTLDLDCANVSFCSITNQKCKTKFDELIIYNTHEEELSNESVLDIAKVYNFNNVFKKISIFPYDKNTHKSLGGDVHAIRKHATTTLDKDDRVLIMKSDSVLSANYFDDVLNILPTKDVYFVAPWVCAKKRVTNDEILDYSLRNTFIRSDKITFFVEDQYQSNNNDFIQRPGIKVTDDHIKFTSCYVIRDFSCHFLSVGLLPLISISEQSWGGVNFSNLIPYFIATDRSFVVHKFHDIVSENRTSDREGPVKDWLNS